jgi:hypothetical protein
VWIGYVAFVVWLRRYFVGAGPRTRAADAVASARVT